MILISRRAQLAAALARHAHLLAPEEAVATGTGREAYSRPADLNTLLRRQLYVLSETLAKLEQLGIDIPTIADALGSKVTPWLPRRSSRPWRLKANSNMALVAHLLKGAGAAGMSEAELVAALFQAGRLQTASNPRRAVHWTVRELARRTSSVFRAPQALGRRWYYRGDFDGCQTAGEVSNRDERTV